MTGYTKQAPFNSALFGTTLWFSVNTEFTNISNAFNATSGHTHDGTSGGGGPISASSITTGTLPDAQIPVTLTGHTLASSTLSGTTTLPVSGSITSAGAISLGGSNIIGVGGYTSGVPTNGQGGLFATATDGVRILGAGSTNDAIITNKFGNIVVQIPTGTRSVALGLGLLSTAAITGFVYIPTVPGTPTGTPVTISGFVPMAYDTTTNTLYIYNGGWKSSSVFG